MKKIVSVMLCVAMLMAALCFGVSAEKDFDAPLKFNEDGKFKIMQVADLQDEMVLNSAVKAFLEAAVADQKPDLVVLTGDNISGGSCESGTKCVDRINSKNAINQFMSIFEEYEVPVAVVFGNHDDENKLSKEELMDIYEEYDCFIGEDEGDAIFGCGTYNLPIYSSKDSSKMAYNLWMFDSNTYDEELGGYDYVRDDQVEWYVNKSNELKAANGGESVPSMVFQHIIVKEIFDLIDEHDEYVEGAKLEKNGKFYTFKSGVLKSGSLKEYPCPPTRQGKQFKAIQAQGDVVAMFFGHDHNNTFIADYNGIDLVATPGMTFHSYSNEDRGFRIITIDENNTSTYETSIIQFADYFGDSKLAMSQYIMYAEEYSVWERIKAGIVYILSLPIKLIFGYAF